MTSRFRTLGAQGWGKLALALLLAASAVGWDLFSTYRAATELTVQNLERLALVLDKNLVAQMDASLRVLQRIRARMELRDDKTLDREALSNDLVTLEMALPGVRTLLVLDAEGRVLAANRKELLGIDLSQRDYFRLTRDRLDKNTVHVSPPFQTVLNFWGMNMVLRSEGPVGEFAGLISATLDLEYFETMMGSAQFQPDVRAALAHTSGVLYAYFPPLDGMAGKNLAVPGSFFSRHLESGQTASLLSGKVYVSGESRMMAQRTLRPMIMTSDEGLVLALSRDLREVYAPWRRRAAMIGILFAGFVVAAVAVHLAIQRRRRSDAQTVASALDSVRVSEEYFRAVVQDQTEVICRTRADGSLTFANDVFCRFFGIPQGDLSGKLWQMLVHPDDLLLAQTKLRAMSPEYTVVMSENRMRAEKGDFYWMQFVNRGFFDATGRLVEIQFVGRDISERKQAEIALLELHYELERRVEQLGRMAVEVTLAEERERQSAAHDLHDGVGQLLHVVKLKLDALAKCMPGSASGAIMELNGLVSDASRQLRSLTAQLSPPVLKDLGLLPAIHWLAEEMERIYGLHIDVVEACDRLSVPSAESSILFRTVRELLINVAKHARAAKACIEVRCDATRLTIKVSDAGMGIADLGAALATRSHEGGIGLASVRERITALGGAMEFQTSPGQGTTVTLEMPIRPEENINEGVAE